MRKWKVEIWMEDTPPEGEDEHLPQKDIIIAMEKAKVAIEEQWDGLKVKDFDVYIDKENDLKKREGL